MSGWFIYTAYLYISSQQKLKNFTEPVEKPLWKLINYRSQTARWGSLPGRKLSISCESLCVLNCQRFQSGEQERPACMWVTCPDAGFTIPLHRSQYHKLCKSGQSFSHSSILHLSITKLCLMFFSRTVHSSRNEEASIYLVEVGGNGPTWMFLWLAAFCSSPVFGCSFTNSGLCSVLPTCPRLQVDALVVLNQDSWENLLATNNLHSWGKY